MSERKVLNKYYPPDYDPALIPKLKLAKDRQYVIRVMAPFHMRCKTCGNYIYKGTKFNSRKETVQDQDYLGLRIFRFYIKCTKCVAEITFKTDPENTDYVIEHGATRNFEAEKLLQEQEKQEEKQKEEDENNPMKLLENRTRDSKREMERMENLEELMDLNKRQAKVNYEGMLERYQETDEQRQKREAEEDEEEMKAIFGSNKVRRLNDADEESEDARLASSSKIETKAPSDFLVSSEKSVKKIVSSNDSKPTFTPANKVTIKKKAQLLGIVKKKQSSDKKDGDSSPALPEKNAENSSSSSSSSSSNGDNQNIKSATAGGLGLLGAYGSDDSNSSSEDEK